MFSLPLFKNLLGKANPLPLLVDLMAKDKAYTCTKFDTCENHSLKSNHEESDSRVWFRAFQCAGHKILICSTDTDTVHIGLSLLDKYGCKSIII